MLTSLLLATVVLQGPNQAPVPPVAPALPVRVGSISGPKAANEVDGVNEADKHQSAPLPPPPTVDAKHQAELDSDTAQGKKYSEQVEKELKLSKDAEGLKRVQRIGAEIAAIANKTPIIATWGDKRFSTFNYTFKVIEGKDVNAFSLPGGFIYVYEGLLKYVESDDELAGVLAHEISHASLRHVSTLEHEYSKLEAFQLPLILIAILTGGSAGSNALTLGSLLGQATGSGWSVKAEQAADYGGFQYMLKTKYNPTGMLTMMERLARDERNSPNIDLGIYRSHPPSKERALALTMDMERSQIPIRRSQVATSFRCVVKPGDNGLVEIEFSGKKIVAFAGTNALTRADQTADALNEFFDSSPELFDVQLGEPGWIMARRLPLFKLAEEDAEAEKKPMDVVQLETLASLKLAIYRLAYRVWDTR